MGYKEAVPSKPMLLNHKKGSLTAPLKRLIFGIDLDKIEHTTLNRVYAKRFSKYYNILERECQM
ncbi:hypothetical protein J2TS6_12440 [Paenibacillus albilobatus]|uniref:Uncharacterized protein n=1 Tax=Paenibacillus albilobatus TaxID=2716884 RepID=A0A920C9Q8_9BACL|nr:hypothetical protein J2TS6_12440 [Paenibacillus albilobatus]